MKRLLFALTTLLTATSAFAITNPGFETGDFTGWSLSPGSLGSVVTSYDATGDVHHYIPVEGSYFALIQTGAGPGVYTMLSQPFSIGAAQSLSGWAAFDTGDYLPYNDDAYVHILDSSNIVVATPWSSSVGAVGNFGSSLWTSWTWTATLAGTYTVEFGVANQGDNAADSFALFDAVQQSSVPEGGATAFLLAIAIGSVVLLRRFFGIATS